MELPFILRIKLELPGLWVSQPSWVDAQTSVNVMEDVQKRTATVVVLVQDRDCTDSCVLGWRNPATATEFSIGHPRRRRRIVRNGKNNLFQAIHCSLDGIEIDVVVSD